MLLSFQFFFPFCLSQLLLFFPFSFPSGRFPILGKISGKKLIPLDIVIIFWILPCLICGLAGSALAGSEIGCAAVDNSLSLVFKMLKVILLFWLKYLLTVAAGEVTGKKTQICLWKSLFLWDPLPETVPWPCLSPQGCGFHSGGLWNVCVTAPELCVFFVWLFPHVASLFEQTFVARTASEVHYL